MYPLLVHSVVNDIFVVIIGSDSCTCPTAHRIKLLAILRVCLRLIMAVLPIVVAFFVSNLVDILEYGGLIGFATSLFFPTALQLRSVYMCKKAFALSSITRPQEMEEKEQLLSTNSQENTEKRSFLQRFAEGRSEYMTPFSSQVFSHPIAVVIVGILDICLFLIGIASLFVSPAEMTCNDIII